MYTLGRFLKRCLMKTTSIFHWVIKNYDGEYILRFVEKNYDCVVINIGNCCANIQNKNVIRFHLLMITSK
jgi:hypothetical protein